MFKLEALKARHGDCLLLHWGEEGEACVALIDGGPATVYAENLRPRLRELAPDRGGDLFIDLLMVSHIDDDHINGVLSFAKELDDNRTGVVRNDGRMPVYVRRLWHNSLEELLDDPLTSHEDKEVMASMSTALAILPDQIDECSAHQFYYSKVLASVPQGQELHGYAQRLKWKMNAGFSDPPLITRRKQMKKTTFHQLELTIVAPSLESVEALRKVWKEKRKEGVLAAYSDRSPYNLSSIVALAEFGGRRILLTGDARGDHILEGLEAAGLLDEEGCIHVDALKLPHHGSKNNVTKEFFERVTADNYIVSGDRVKFPNPSQQTMAWLYEVRDGSEYRLFCTYEFEDMSQLFGSRLVTPKAGAKSVIVSIGADA